MSDFCQPGLVTTLHRLNHDGLLRLESELERHTRSTPIGLVLPALYSEFQTPAMRGIVTELGKVRYLNRIVLALDRANSGEYEHARSFFRDFKTPVTILWMDSEPVQELFRTLAEKGLPSGDGGKGRSCWLASGYLLACGDCDVIAIHDCDIVNYERKMLARLCYPLVHPAMDFEFCKAFYSRVADRMYGRVTRLFAAPLIRALDDIVPAAPLLRFLDSFRYLLAGEVSMKKSLAASFQIPSNWGLEIGTLAEVFRNVPAQRVCQVDLADNYEHKHQSLSAADPTKGLVRMSREIATALLRSMAAEGIVLDGGALRTLEVRYLRIAEDMVNRYEADALLNGLTFDRHAENTAVTVFAHSLAQAEAEFVKDPLGLPPIPSWRRVISAAPDFYARLKDAAAVQQPSQS
ncbi:MAG: glycosyl transferase, partial [Bryobacteraceae bacterium]